MGDILEKFKKSDVIDAIKESGFALDDDLTWTILLIELLIPEKAKDSLLYKNTVILNCDIKYSEVMNYLEIFDHKTKRVALNYIRNYKAQSETDKYIKKIINDKRVNIREKLLIVLIHFEKLLYETSKVSKTKYGIKSDVGELTKEDLEMGSYGFSVIVMYGIAKIVFADTRKFKETIDKRIPFRNHILHNGIVEYNDNGIKEAYEILLIMVSELFLFKARPPKRKKDKNDDVLYF